MTNGDRLNQIRTLNRKQKFKTTPSMKETEDKKYPNIENRFVLIDATGISLGWLTGWLADIVSLTTTMVGLVVRIL